MNESITVVGNVASVPERRDLPSGGGVTSFRLAVTQRRFDRDTSAWADGHTNWFTVSVFRALGENVYRSVHKSDRVVVSGRLRLREWETDAKKGVTAEIDAEALGHDLLWGVSVFQRGTSSGGSAPREATADTAGTATESVDMSETWAAPGAERELVPSGGDTPF